ncbi:hypothetical protein EJ07DRAFT_150891 [Lizonia empirigonia]|nr:hypothetical protein EJ07DRAFT_150891 [Lizonia empirigonia]
MYVLGYATGPLPISPPPELVLGPLFRSYTTLLTVSTPLYGTSSSKSGLAAARLFMGKHTLPPTVSRAFQHYPSKGSRSVFALPPSSIADTFPRETRGAAEALTVVRHNLGPFLALLQGRTSTMRPGVGSGC